MHSSNVIRRGSTQTHVFAVDIDLTNATVFVTYTQNGKVVCEKTGGQIVVEADAITVPLSQADTLAFRTGDTYTAEVQIRYVTESGDADVSDVIPLRVDRALKDGVITYVRSNT